MSDKLLSGEAQVGEGIIMTGREWAADNLLTVSHHVRSGTYPRPISLFDLGRALGRAIINSPETDDDFQAGIDEIVRGIEHYRNRKNT